MSSIDRLLHRQNSHLTFKANQGEGRHGWLRLTPAYSVKLVRQMMLDLPAGSVVTDPFSGTATTPLAAAEMGLIGQSIDINPFLVWLGNTKIRNYEEEVIIRCVNEVSRIIDESRAECDFEGLWQPALHKIERWWSPGALAALKAIRSQYVELEGDTRDLLDVIFCRTIIKSSNAAFNHPSMSFKAVADEDPLFQRNEFESVLDLFEDEATEILQSARLDLSEGSGKVVLGDSRSTVDGLDKADAIVTSPPYANRMSYIRELRPYMYWLGYLEKPSDAGELDWQAIGGTWGTATSRTGKWQPTTQTPVDAEIGRVTSEIANGNEKNGPLLAKYVHKYHHDMWEHFQSISALLKPGGTASYIVGNSTFYGNEVPVHEWYAEMMIRAGFEQVTYEIIRKRNSNKKLYEFNVSGKLSR